jgi:hypothetical protein
MTIKSKASATVKGRIEAIKKGPQALWDYNIQAAPEPTMKAPKK